MRMRMRMRMRTRYNAKEGGGGAENWSEDDRMRECEADRGGIRPNRRIRRLRRGLGRRAAGWEVGFGLSWGFGMLQKSAGLVRRKSVPGPRRRILLSLGGLLVDNAPFSLSSPSSLWSLGLGMG
uniref:Uncharacterized protein n=3 Tax=Physcomitrium patens TaxID=3218 RepID=A0A7I3ZB00_PHYPA